MLVPSLHQVLLHFSFSVFLHPAEFNGSLSTFVLSEILLLESMCGLTSFFNIIPRELQLALSAFDCEGQR